MHIEFKNVIIHNFMSFGHSQLYFTDDGFIKVTGINENPDDNAMSNGSGKSSLWESIIWAITGETIRGTKQVANLYGDDGTYVALEFNLDNTNYKILRSKDHKQYKTNLQIFINDKDCSGKGIRESEKLLQQYIPDITASLLGSVIILGQGLPQKFTNNTPSGRKEVLEKLSKSDFMIEDLKSRVTKRKFELTTEIRGYQDSVLSNESQVSILNKQVEEANNKLSRIDKTELEQKLSEVRTVEVELHDRISLVEDSINRIDSDRSLINDKLMKLNSEMNISIREVEDEYLPKIAENEKSTIELRTHLNHITSEINKINSIKEICPTCGQKLIGVEKPDPSALIIEKEDLLKDLKTLESIHQALTEEKKTIISNVKLNYANQITEINSQLTTLNKESSHQNQIKIETQNRIKECVCELNKLSSELSSIDATITYLHNLIDENERTLTTLAWQIKADTESKENAQSHLDIINKFDTALKRDFRGYLLSTIIDYISNRAIEYCKVIFETDKISFRLDGNNIEISYLDKAYENLSGGEKQKIDLIVQFSIRDMLCNHLGFTSNILVLDEVFDGLDMIGCQKVLDVISAMNDVKNVYIVTHRKDLSIPCDKEITVIKSCNGISELK